MNTATHWIAKRQTFEGTTVYLWPDGALTWSFGTYIRGSAHPRSIEQSERALTAGWLVLGEVEIYDDEEVPDLIRAARWTAERGGLPGDLRRRFSELRAPKLRPVWTVIETDRDGRPLIRCWILPRMIWPGLGVWWDRGIYSVWTEIARSGAYAPTGCEFSNLRELGKYLADLRAQGAS